MRFVKDLVVLKFSDFEKFQKYFRLCIVLSIILKIIMHGTLKPRTIMFTNFNLTIFFLDLFSCEGGRYNKEKV